MRNKLPSKRNPSRVNNLRPSMEGYSKCKVTAIFHIPRIEGGAKCADRGREKKNSFLCADFGADFWSLCVQKIRF